jgi:hypothetical protein
VGLGLGVRLSWAPFYLSFVVLVAASARWRAVVTASVACVAWVTPLVLLTGPARLLQLLRTHGEGHLRYWGGTALTQSSRAPFVLRDLFVDGLGCGGDPLGLVIVATLVLAAVVVARSLFRGASPEASLHAVATLAILVVPYLAWILVGQNLKQQPRHVLPLLVVGLVWLARQLLLAPPRLARVAGGALALVVVTQTTLDAVARRGTPPAGAQLLQYLREHSGVAPPESTAVFASTAARFLDGTEWQRSVHPAATMGDALLAMSRLDVSPARVFVTSELTGLADAPGRATEVATFCRPERLDRRMPCLNLYALDVKASPAR